MFIIYKFVVYVSIVSIYIINIVKYCKIYIYYFENIFYGRFYDFEKM